MSHLYFFSRFPRFMSNQRHLWSQESVYVVFNERAVRHLVTLKNDLEKAPRCYEDFSAAARADVLAWPCLYVHRFANDAQKFQPGDVVSGHRAQEGAQFVGNIAEVRENLESGRGLARFRKVSVGGNNRYDVPFPAL